MAISIIQCPSFDATLDYTLSFTWIGNQSFGNRLVIKRNSDNVVIYDNTQNTFQLKHTIASNSLVNGVEYNAQIQSIDGEGVHSAFSNLILFKCLTTPSFNMNVTPNQIVKDSQINIVLTYSQIEGELLNSYQIIQYNSSQIQIYATDILYSSDSLGVTLKNLTDSTQYYVRATGETVNGMILDTGLIEFSVSYINPSGFYIVGLENLPDQGTIKITSNIISIDGIASPTTPPSYIDNEKVDLTTIGENVVFNSGFEINGDFSGEKLVQKMNSSTIIDAFSDGTYNIEIKYMKATFDTAIGEQIYFLLNAYNALTSYRIATVPMNIPTDDQQIYVLYQRKNNIYDIKSTLKV